jgi:hypothetical protein
VIKLRVLRAPGSVGIDFALVVSFSIGKIKSTLLLDVSRFYILYFLYVVFYILRNWIFYC